MAGIDLYLQPPKKNGELALPIAIGRPKRLRKILTQFNFGELAQLARALAWHARGHRFDSGILHTNQYRV